MSLTTVGSVGLQQNLGTLEKFDTNLIPFSTDELVPQFQPQKRQQVLKKVSQIKDTCLVIWTGEYDKNCLHTKWMAPMVSINF